MRSPPRTAVTVSVVALVFASAVAVGAVHATEPRPSTTDAATEAAQTASNESNASVSLWRVPHHVDAANASASELEQYDDARADDAGAEAPVEVSPGDHLAVAIHVDGLDAFAANRTGTETERVLAALNASGHFSVRQTSETTTPEVRSATLWLNASNVRAVDAPADDRYVLIVEAEAVLAVRAPEMTARSEFAETYATGHEDYRFEGLYGDVTVSVAEYTARYYANDSERSLIATSDAVSFTAATVDFDVAGPLEPTANATVTGATTLAPGSELEVAARTDAAGTVATDVVTVDETGGVEAILDLSGVDLPTTVTFTAGRTDESAREVLVSEDTVRVLEPHATVAFDDQTTTTRYVSAQANLSHGGALVLRNDSGVLDVTTELAAGSNRTVTFTLPTDAANGTYTVVAYRSTADDRGDPYSDGTVNATATIEVATDEDGEEPTTTAVTTVETTTSTTAATTTASTQTTDSGQPGFGALAALAAVATLAGVRLAVRRRES